MDEMKHYLLKSLMLLAAIATSAGVSAYDFEADGVYFNVLSEADGTVEVTYNKDKPYDFSSIPPNIQSTVRHNGRSYTVVAVGDSAFYYNNGGGGVGLPDSVVKIGELSFGLPYDGGGYGQVQFSVSTVNPAFVSIDCGLYSKDFKVLYHYSNQAYPLYIPDDLEEIGSCALAGCWDIDSLSLPNTLKKIGSYAFYQSSIESLKVPDTVTEIGDYAFCGTNLKELILPPSLDTISRGCFSGTKITSALLPDNIKEIGDDAFFGCTYLTDLKLPQSLEKLGKGAFGSSGINHHIKIPMTLTEIPDGLFSGTDIPSVEIPTSVTTIGDEAFDDCFSLAEVHIPSSVTTIGDFAFSRCFSLTELHIPNSVTSIGRYAFYGLTKLKSVYVPSSVTHIGVAAFSNCYFDGNSIHTEIVVDPDNPVYTSIDGVLYDKDVTSLICCPGGKSEISIPNTVKIIDEEAFEGCRDMATIELPPSVVKIGRGAFAGCTNLKNVEINGSLKEIGELAFIWTFELKTLSLPASMEKIGSEAFDSGIQTFYCLAQTPPLTDGTPFYGNIYSGATLYVPDGSLSAYRSAPGWQEFENIEALGFDFVEEGLCYRIMPDGHAVEITDRDDDYAFGETLEIPSQVTSSGVDYAVTSIARYALYDVGGQRDETTTIIIPETVINIGGGAFNGTFNGTKLMDIEVDANNPNYMSSDGALYDKAGKVLVACPPARERLDILDGVTELYEGAVASCTNLSELQLPSSVVTIGRGAFAYTSGLKRVGLPASLENIDNLAFYYSGIESIELPCAMTEIKDSVFSCCRSLVDIRIPDSVTSIGEEAFNYCTSLREINLPVSVTEIGRAAFRDSFRLASIDLPASLMKIGGQAFDGCDSLSIVSCQAMTPPEAADDTFMDETYTVATLIVPDGARGGYEVAEVWCNFLNIEESDFSGIGEAAARKDMTVTVEDGTLVVSGLPDDVQVGIYTVGGQLVYVGRNRVIDVPGKGVYIIRAGNSTAKIVI